MSNGNGQPPKTSVASSYDNKFLDDVAQSEMYKKWASNKNKVRTATTNAFDTERHKVAFDSSNMDEVPEGVNPFLNQFADLTQEDPYNEIRAAHQSGWEQAAKVLPRAAIKAAAEVAKLPGYLGGAAMAPFAKENEGWDTFVNNSWIKSMSQMEGSLKEDLLPVYTAKAVKEGDLWDNITSPAFWATEGADGIGFIASMFVPGAAMKSLNLGEKIMGLTAKGAELASGESKMAGAVRTLSEKLGIKSPEAFDVATTSLANTFIESAAEAGGAGENFERNHDNFIKEQIAKGMNLELAESLFKEQKANLERNVFMSNVPILIVPNAIQSSMIWGKAGAKVLDATVPTLGKKILNRVGNVAGATLSEGFIEEAGQSTVENMFTEKAKRGELKGSLKDFNISELSDNYLSTISSTDGQKAMFLGAFLGGGMSAYHGAKEDIQNRKESGTLLAMAKEGVNHYNAITERDIYKRDENGQVMYHPNNKPILDEAKVLETARDLDHIDADGKEFEQAVAEGNDSKVKYLKDKAVNNLISPFITKGEVGLQALKQHLDETSKATDIQENNEPSQIKEFTNSIMEKAKKVQDRYEAYKGFSKSLINLSNENATKSDYEDYYNQLADFYIARESEHEDAKTELKKLEGSKKKLDSYKDESYVVNEELDDQFKKGEISQVDYLAKKEEGDPRVKLLNDQIKEQKDNIKKLNKTINEDLWDPKKVNESFGEFINQRVEVRKKAAEIEKLVSELSAVTAAKTVKELDDIVTENEGVKDAINKRRTLLKSQEEAKKTVTKKASKATNNRKQITAVDQFEGISDLFEEGDEVPLNDENNHLGLKKENVEGKRMVVKSIDKDAGNIIITDGDTEHTINFDTIAKGFGSNTEGNFGTEGGYNPTNVQTPETVTSSKDSVHTSVDSRLITVDPATNEPYPWIDPAAVEFERVPVNKTGADVSFILNTGDNGNLSEDQQKALEMITKDDYSNLDFLAKHLPLDGRFSSGAKASIETYNKATEDKFMRTSYPMRMAIVTEMSKGIKPESITTTIAGQNNGDLQIAPKVDDKVAENSILGLYEIANDIDKIKMENVYMVNDSGTLTNGKGNVWAATRKLAKGEIYLKIHTAAGTPFPLKLNVKKINEKQATALYELYKYRFEDIKEKGKSTLLTNLPADIQEVIKANLAQELELFAQNKDPYENLTIKDIIDFLIWDGSKNPKSQVRFYDNKLLVGNNTYEQEDFDNDVAKADFIGQLTSDNAREAKRHHIRFKDKKAGIKSLTVDNPNGLYLKYLINSGTLNTNAAVNTPSFQGNTSIYLTPDNVQVNGKKSEFNPTTKRDKFKKLIGSVSKLIGIPKAQGHMYGLGKLSLTLKGKNYKDKYGNLYSRVSEFKGGTEIKDSEGIGNAAKRGNIIDNAFRDFFLDTKHHTLENFKEMFEGHINTENKGNPKNPMEFSDEVITKLFNTFNSYADLFLENDWVVYSNGFKVGARFNNLGPGDRNEGRVAGTTDFLVQDTKSKQFFIIDIKTSSIDRSSLEGYNGDVEDQHGYADKDKIQLNMYSHIIETMNPNTSISGLYILPITLKAKEKSYASVYEDADMLSDFDENKALLEVDMEPVHELLGLEEDDLKEFKLKRTKGKGGFNVSGVKGKATKSTTQLEKEEGNAAAALAGLGGEAFDVKKLADLLEQLGGVLNEATTAQGKPKVTVKAKPAIIKPKANVAPKAVQFNLGNVSINAGMDLETIGFTDADKVTINGKDYFLSPAGKKANRYAIAERNSNGTPNFDVDIDIATIEEIKKVRFAANLKGNIGDRAVVTEFDKIWKSRLESVSLQKESTEAPLGKPVVVSKKGDTPAEIKTTVNTNRANKASDSLDFSKLSEKEAGDALMKIMKAYRDNANIKQKIGEHNKDSRGKSKVEALKSMVDMLIANSISSEEVRKICE